MIVIPRGDTGYYDVEVFAVIGFDDSGEDILEVVPLEDGDTIYFTVKTSTTTEVKTIQKVITDFDDGVAVVKIEPEDTKDLAYGDYVYDVQLTDKDGDVTTIIRPNVFRVMDEVTYE